MTDYKLVPAGTLKAIHRDLDACQRVIWLAGGFDPAYCHDAQARLKEIDALLAAPDVQGEPEESAQQTLDQISDLFRIGKCARTPAAILANVQNAHRFAGMLHAVEREFFMIDGEPDEDFPDDEPQPECLLNCYGSTAEQYVEQFRRALEIIRPAPQPVEPQPCPVCEGARVLYDPYAGDEYRCEPCDGSGIVEKATVPVATQQPPADVSGLVDALGSMICAYRMAIQAGHARITALGGDCDSVDRMLSDFAEYGKAVELHKAHRKGGDA